jgi:hypothetical protein
LNLRERDVRALSKEKCIFLGIFLCRLIFNLTEKLGMDDMSSTDEVQRKIRDFLNKFASRYLTPGPLTVSFIGPLNEALNHSLFQPTIVNFFFILKKE